MNISIHKGDITKLKVDGVVNAANTSLLGGGGVDGAIHRAGGPKILEECRAVRNRQGGCKVGEAVATTAGNLDARYVIHTVGPKWNNGNSGEAQKLENCYINSLKIADELGLESIAFPNISTGIYGYPKIEAAQIALRAVQKVDGKNIQHLTFVCFDDESFRIYEMAMQA